MDLQPETILHERYKIIKLLGQGGMGSVYLAWDQTLDTQVAVKSNFNPAPESVDQFLREARLLAALRHPNLPRVTDYFVIDKEQFLVMDFIPGDDLNQGLKENGAQSLAAVLAWSAQLTDALSYMHSQKPPVVHRDIKPANIKLTPEGKAILVDFGIAKVDNAQAQTATGAEGYTPGYAPPEQYGQGRTGPYSDQFSLAATMYALLTAIKPADSIQRVMGKATLHEPHELNPDIPQNISDAILKAMSLQTEDRFASVSEFQSALDNPDFRLNDRIRDEITSIPKPQNSKTRRAPLTPTDRTVVAPSGKKKGKRTALVIGGIAAVAVICLLTVASLLFVFPSSPVYLLAGRQPTSAPTEILIAATPEATRAEVTVVEVIQPSATFTLAPSATPTDQPTPTLTPELVGQSGVIAFASDRGEDGIIQIWTMRVIRTPQGDVRADSFTQLTFSEGDKDQPVWSPDGSRIAFVAPGGAANGLDIWVMDADGNNTVNLTQHAGDEFDPAWSPDGKMIAFTHHLRDAGNTPIYALTAIKPDGTGRVRLSEDFVEWDPAFSPDGKWLLYIISASSHDYFYFRAAWNDFTEPKTFDLRSLFGEFGEVSDPAWAPVGDQFAYVTVNGNRWDIIHVTYVQMEQNGLHQPTEYVLTETGHESDPAWSPDTRWLAFTSTRDNQTEIYLMPTTGRPQVNLTERPGVDQSPDWMPVLDGD
jgi:serine/threonine protein kinase/Tol biopolymer transport system component